MPEEMRSAKREVYVSGKGGGAKVQTALSVRLRKSRPVCATQLTLLLQRSKRFSWRFVTGLRATWGRDVSEFR